MYQYVTNQVRRCAGLSSKSADETQPFEKIKQILPSYQLRILQVRKMLPLVQNNNVLVSLVQNNNMLDNDKKSETKALNMGEL